MTGRGAGIVACLACLVLAGCPNPQPGPTPSPSISASPSATPSIPAAWDLTLPGHATAAVAELQASAGQLPIIKVDLTRTTASLSAVQDGRVVAWIWERGEVSSAESDIEYINQASFSPSAYDFNDLDGLFQTAAGISGSASAQELQIVEYNQGQVLMTVTTRPESMPVFFRADGTPIHQLDFTTASGFAEAIQDATLGHPRVLVLGWSQSSGLWAEVPGAEPGVIDRTTRQAKVPAWTSSRKATSQAPTFPVAALEAEVLARLVRELPQQAGRPDAQVGFTIERTDQMALPTITWDVGGQQVVTTLSGTDITDEMR